LLTEANHVLDQSRQAETNNLEPALTALDFQNSMLQVIDQLEHMRTDLVTAKVQLAALINAPIDTPLVLAGVPTNVPPPPSFIDHNKLETLGLALRPELREEAYQEKIDRQDVYKEMIKMMPGIGVLGDVNYDSNKYLYNPTWGGFGIQATYNLVSLIDGPKAISAAKASVQVAHVRRLALSVAVLTQVNLSLQEYLAAQQDLNISKQIADVQGRIEVASHNEKTALDQSEAESIRRDLEQLAAEFAYNRSVAQVHTALADLYSAVGVDLVPPTINTDDLTTLSTKVGPAIAGWEAGALPDAEVPASLQEISSATTPQH